MRSLGVLIPVLACSLCLVETRPLFGQAYETAIVETAGQVLDEIMAIPARGIPESLLADAQAIVIIPDLIKGGFVVGVRHGRGVVVTRDEKGNWAPPMFATLTGGSVGWQIGLQSIDMILVFKTRSSVQRLLQGKFTLGADAAAAAGPVGRQAAAATDLSLRAEILSYSRSRGLFAGVSLDGSVLQIDLNSNAIYYATSSNQAAGGQPALPPSAGRLLNQLTNYTATPAAGATSLTPTPDQAMLAPAGGVISQTEATRRQLAEATRQLATILDDDWRRYLALPAQVYAVNQTADVESLNQSLAKFEAIRSNPQYQQLAQRPEFVATYSLLKSYIAQQSSHTPTLALPPPPTVRR
jgi:lipid-binding SYLF domain-containing protein